MTRISKLDAIFASENISHAGPTCSHETGEPIQYYSSAPCDTCTTLLAGYRYEVVFVQTKTFKPHEKTICIDCFLDLFGELDVYLEELDAQTRLS